MLQVCPIIIDSEFIEYQVVRVTFQHYSFILYQLYVEHISPGDVIGKWTCRRCSGHEDEAS